MHQLKIFFFNDTATTEIYTLSLHDALPIYTPARESKVERDEETEYQGGVESPEEGVAHPGHPCQRQHHSHTQHQDRKSTRLNSSHANISYAVFCLKKKKYNKPYYVFFSAE